MKQEEMSFNEFLDKRIAKILDSKLDPLERTLMKEIKRRSYVSWYGELPAEEQLNVFESRANCVWKDEEDNDLIVAYKRFVEKMAKFHLRTPGAIKYRLAKLAGKGII